MKRLERACSSRLCEVVRACARMRGVASLYNRTIVELGQFLIDMERFLMHGKKSENTFIRRFQEVIEPELYNPFDIDQYIELFAFYCQFIFKHVCKEVREEWRIYEEDENSMWGE